MNKRMIFRLSDQMYDQINQAIKQGKAKNPSDLIRAALKEFLTKEASADG